jgi:hypothetical protein
MLSQVYAHVSAQVKNRNIRTKALINASNEATAINSYLVPEFYFFTERKNGDTSFEFKCYDYRDSIINTVEQYDSVHFYSLFKSFTDSAHTYKDSNGQKKLLPVSSIIKRYDRISGTNKWMTIEYPGNKYVELIEDKNTIISTDTVILLDPIDDKRILKIFNHYKVTPLK